MTDISRPVCSSVPLTIRLFGAFELQRNGCPLPPTRSRKEQWLLALLLLRRYAPLDRHWLAGVLWPDSEETWALQNLRRSLSNLRSVLGEDAYRLTAPSPRTLLFDVSSACIDLLDFDEAMKTTNRSHQLALNRAVELYRGPLLEGCFEEWLLPERAAREQQYLNTLESLAAISEPMEAVPLLRRATSVDPARETALRALLRALAAGGDHAGMIQSYRDFRHYLSRELNTSPDAETTELYRQLRAQARDGLRPYAPEQVPLKPALSHLPSPTTSLIGRETELREILDLLANSRLVTLTGAGGIGKTRLAIAAAEAVNEDFTDGARFVDLAPVDDPVYVMDAVALALGARAEPHRSLLETLTAHLQHRSLLLILDNCEHLIDACASLASALMIRCPQLRLLATSRHLLGVAGERAWRVSALSMHADPSEGGPVEQSSAVTTPPGEPLPVSGAELLFADRATAVSPSFRITEQNRHDVAEVCRLVEGVPFAIELAAHWARALPVAQIAARLRQRFDLLKAERPDVLSRHQTLRATLDWSYRLLSPQEQQLLSRLSVFIGGWTLEAAEAVCGDDSADPDLVLELLASLVDKSLAVYEDREGDARYHLHEIARQYAREKLGESGEASVIESRHRNYFLALAKSYETPFMDMERSRQYRRMEREYNNLRRALEGYCAGSGDLESGLRLGGALCSFWAVRGYTQEERRLLMLLLQRSDEPTSARSRAMFTAGQMAFDQDDRSAALAWFHQALRLAQYLKDPDLEARTLYYLGILARDADEYSDAHTWLERSLALFRQQKNRQAVTVVLGSLGNLARKQEDWQRAEALFEECLSLCDGTGDQNGVAYIQFSKGLMARQRGDLDRAQSCFEDSLRIWQRSERSWGQSAARHHLGLLAGERGDHPQACEQFTQSLLLNQKRGDRSGVRKSLEALAELAVTFERYEPAAALLGAAFELHEEMAAPDATEDSSTTELKERLKRALGIYMFSTAFTNGRTMKSEELKALVRSLSVDTGID